MECLAFVKEQALSIGFDACGVARCRPMPEPGRALGEWLRTGRHAGMAFMENHTDLRIDPERLAEGTKSVVVCLISYKTDRKYVDGIPQIASYARCRDYHYVVKQKLEQLLDVLKALSPGITGRCFVDSAPVFEKSWAVEAGLGWTGRHSLLIHPELGSCCFIGTILTSFEPEEYDLPFAENHCGTCRRCIDACPTAAIQEGGSIDARRCCAYQTIENRGPIPDELVPALGARLFGCDTCQDVCPWNAKPTPQNHAVFEPVEGVYDTTGEEWLGMGSGEFKRCFGRTPLARAGLKKIKQTLRQKNKPVYGE